MSSDRIENAMSMNQDDLYMVAINAWRAGQSVDSSRIANGCGRVYVFVGYKSMRKNSKAVKTLERAGFRMTRRPGDSGVLIYIGYDNATGRQLAIGDAVAQSFRDSGIAAGMVADPD